MTTNMNIAPGVTLHVLPTDKFKTACFSINFVREHSRENAGPDALLPSVLLRATEKYPDIQSISVRLDELYGATFGTLVRRKGDVQLVGFYADFIEDDFLPEGEGVFAELIDFAEQVLLHPYTENGCFCERFVEGEKQNLISAIESNINDKRAYAVRRLLQIMCKDEAYGIPRLGYSEDVAKITPQELWKHYCKILKESRVEIFYAGRRPAEVVAAAFAPLFDRAQAEFACPSTQVVAQAGALKEVSEAMDVTQGKLVMGLRSGITGSQKDYAALLLLNAIFGAGATSKLFVNVREKLSVCYYASSSIDKYNGTMLISSGISFENYEVAKQAILKELEDCKNGVISDYELQSAKSQIISSFKIALDSPTRVDDFYIGMALAPCEQIAELMERVAALEISDVAAAANKLSLDTIYFLKGEEA